MSEFKGTPGPWEVGRVIGCYIEGRNSWSHVCSVMDDHEDSVTEQESIYNRHLIAAAPDLLEALVPTTKLEMWTESADDDELVIMSVGTVRKMRAAVAKALGEEK